MPVVPRVKRHGIKPLLPGFLYYVIEQRAPKSFSTVSRERAQVIDVESFPAEEHRQWTVTCKRRRFTLFVGENDTESLGPHLLVERGQILPFQMRPQFQDHLRTLEKICIRGCFFDFHRQST